MKGRTVTLITGTRKGIGRFLVHHYLEQGHTVIGCSRKAPDWEAKGYSHHLLDVGDEKQVVDMFRRIAETETRLDNLINNAGIGHMNSCALTPMTAVHDMLKTNVAGTFLFSREAVRLMASNENGGRIVNFSSVATPLRLEGEAMYAASKAAVVSLTQIMAREFAPFGVTVNCVGPNPVMTDLIEGVPDDKIKSVIARQAIPRLGTFEDIANVVDFFLSEKSAFITGQNIYLGGAS